MNRTNETSTNSNAAGEPDGAMRRVLLAFALDLVAIVVFIAIGRRNHDEDLSLTGFLGTLAPFVIALAVTWFIARVWNHPIDLKAGVTVWIGTVAIGMVLRRFVFDDGTATAFIIVASVFIGALVNGWRTYARFRASS
ncbi:MAG: DUF3054 domain-containing protein [Actinomycetota bacterium]